MRLQAAIVLASVAIAACGNDLGSQPGVTVTDSAGIRIVESRAPAWTPETAWRIEPEPVLAIGEREGEDPYLLDTVMGATRLSDGTIVAAVLGTSDLRFYDTSGRHITSVGRAGEGPGEFGQILTLSRMRGDTLVVLNGGRHSIFTKAGVFIRSTTPEGAVFESAGGMIVRPTSVLHDGTLLGWGTPQSLQQRSGMWIDSAPIVLFDRDGDSPREVADLPAVLFAGDGARARRPEFSPRRSLAIGPDYFYYNFADSYDIERNDLDGNLQAIYRRPVEPEPVTDAHVAQYREAFLSVPDPNGGTSPEWRATQERRFSQLVFAETMPVHGPMRLDRTEHLWVQYNEQIDYTEGGRFGFGGVPIQPQHFSIFAPEGVWLGDIETPARFTIFEIGADYLLGVTRDEMGAESILMYRLVRDGAPAPQSEG